MKVIFITGTGHCGSTLLDLLLDGHSQIIGVGEFKNFVNEKDCTCGRTLSECEIWRTFVEDNNLSGLKVYRNKKDFILSRNNFSNNISGKWEKIDDNKEVIRKNEELYNKILDVSGKKVVVDSSKSIDRVDLLSDSKVIEPVVIHLVRDGRGVLWSYAKKYSKYFIFMWKWFAENLKIRISRKRYNYKYIFVSYDELVKNTQETLTQILNTVELEYEKSMLSFREVDHHQIGGNRMRFSGSDEIREDTIWRQKLPLFYKVAFGFLLGWQNFLYKKIIKD